MVGKALCGNGFYFALEDYGFSAKSGSHDAEFIQLDENDTRFNISKNETSSFNKGIKFFKSLPSI